MRDFFCASLGLFALAGCGDPPLLTTPLPGGYSFDSNGGRFGYIKSPSGQRLSEYFGKLYDGTERWCNEFAWAEAVVVCAMEVYRDDGLEPTSHGYFVYDTKAALGWFVADMENVQESLQDLSVSPLPELARRHRSTRRK